MFQYYFFSSRFSILATKQYKAYHAPCDIGDPRTGQSCIFQYRENQEPSRRAQSGRQRQRRNPPHHDAGIGAAPCPALRNVEMR